MNKEIKQLPKDWKWVKLDDALDYVIGGDWGKDKNFEDSNYGLAYCIRGSEIKNWEEEKGRTASLRKIKQSNIEKRKLVEGDVLVEISGGGPEQPVGRTVLIDKAVLSYRPEIPKICTNFLRLIRPKDFIEGKFLNLYLKHFYYSGEIVKYQGGSNNLRNLKFPDYVKINIPLPPKPTQLAIVSKIGELFSEIENGINSLLTAKEQLKKYRQSVLKWAFEGKLTNGLNYDLHDLPDEHDLSIAAEPETEYKVEGNHGNQANQKNHGSDKGGLPEGWKWVKLGELMESVRNGYSKKPDDKGKVKILRISSVRPNKISFEDVRFLEKPLDSINQIRENDLLFTRYNGSTDFVGVCGRVPAISEIIFYPDKLIRCRPVINDGFHSTYIQYAANFGKARKYILSKIKTTAGQTGIAGSEIKELPIPLPPMKEQNLIVQAIESRLSVADKMEESITESLHQAEALKQSILKKAFEGRLI